MQAAVTITSSLGNKQRRFVIRIRLTIFLLQHTSVNTVFIYHCNS